MRLLLKRLANTLDRHRSRQTQSHLVRLYGFTFIQDFADIGLSAVRDHFHTISLTRFLQRLGAMRNGIQEKLKRVAMRSWILRFKSTAKE